jgi:hypothetical protein
MIGAAFRSHLLHSSLLRGAQLCCAFVQASRNDHTYAGKQPFS